LNFIKTKSEKSIFLKKKNQTEQIIPMSESCSSTQLLFNEKKNVMLKRRWRVKLQTCFFVEFFFVDVWSFNFVNNLRFYYQISTKWSILLISWINNINIIRLKKIQKFIINMHLISYIKNHKLVNCTLTKVLLHWKKNAPKN
jgi:hypothetical protein